MDKGAHWILVHRSDKKIESLKKDYKNLVGVEWKPPKPPSPGKINTAILQLSAEIEKLKSDELFSVEPKFIADKEKKVNWLKDKYKLVTGKAWGAPEKIKIDFKELEEAIDEVEREALEKALEDVQKIMPRLDEALAPGAWTPPLALVGEFVEEPVEDSEPADAEQKRKELRKKLVEEQAIRIRKAKLMRSAVEDLKAIYKRVTGEEMTLPSPGERLEPIELD